MTSIKVDKIVWGNYKKAEFIQGVLRFSKRLKPGELDGLAPVEGCGDYNMPINVELFNSMKRFKDYNKESHKKNYLRIINLIQKEDRWEELMEDIEKGKKEKRRKVQRKNTKLFRQEEEEKKRIRDEQCKNILGSLGMDREEIKETVKRLQ